MWIASLALAAAAAAQIPAGYTFFPGGFERGRGPDGNSVFIEAPGGLILFDTGRHRAHQDKLLAFARKRGKPIAAIVNTHWHLDHSGGNAEIREVHPTARLYASRAVEGALTGFLANSRKQAEAYLASGKADKAAEADMRQDFAAMDAVQHLRPDVPVTATGMVKIAGRPLQVNLASYAATAGDVWLYDPRTRVTIVGDLVVASVPFMDTACPEGWRTALAAIARAPFKTLIPGHGAPMNRQQFETWRTAFGNLLDCAASTRGKDECVAGWVRDAGAFVGEDSPRVKEMVGYYIETRLRAAPAERGRYCGFAATKKS